MESGCTTCNPSGVRVAVLLGSSCLFACAQTPPLAITATGRDQDCSLRVNGVEVSRDALDPGRLRALRAGHDGRAIVDTDPQTPYRCVGATIFDLQRAGFRIVAVTANGRSLTTR